MKKITADAVTAFNNSQEFNRSNTKVTVDTTPDGSTTEVRMFLFGNLIATKINDSLEISNGGWSSNTTKERLNGLPNVSITQKNFVWYLNGEEWDGNWTKIN
jgi:hypothetical protein